MLLEFLIGHQVLRAAGLLLFEFLNSIVTLICGRGCGVGSLSVVTFFFLCVFYFLLTNSRPNSRKNIGINAHSIIKL